MSQQKEVKGKNRYSKSQQFEPIGSFNYRANADVSGGRNAELNPLKQQQQSQQQQLTTQSDYENILKTQEGIIDTEISQHALMFSPNTNILDNESNNEEDDVFDILYNKIQSKDEVQGGSTHKKDTVEENSNEQSEKQGTKKSQQGQVDKPPKQMSYEMQNLMRIQDDTSKGQFFKEQQQSTDIKNIQSIKIPLTEYLEQHMEITRGDSSKNEQTITNTQSRSINQTGAGLRSSRIQNEAIYQDKVRRIQNMKIKKSENDKKLQKTGSLGLSGHSTPRNEQDIQQELFQKEFLRQQRQSLQGTLVQTKDNTKDNQPSKFKKLEYKLDKANSNWDMVKKLNVMMKLKQKLFQIISQRIENLNNFHHYMIGDCTDAPNIKDTGKSINFNSLFYKAFLQTLNPGSFIVIYYKVFLTIYTLFNIIYLPLIFGFDLEISSEFITINTISIFIYLFEMFTRFRISYYHMGEIVTDRKRIFWKYINNEFTTDLISIIALFIGFEKKPALLFILLRNRNVVQYLWDIDNHYYLAERFHATWILLKLFGFIAIMAHYFACVFHYTGMVQEDKYPEYSTWTREFGLIDKTWTLRYNYSIYFSFITCITIGYGDLTPKNTAERNIVILISLISTGCFSYSVNTMATIFQDYLNKSKKSKEMRYDAINYMRERNIHKTLQLRVLKYIEYIYQMEAKSPDKGLYVINQISGHLKTQLFQDYYGKIIAQDKHFSLNYSQETIDKLSLKMKEKIYGPGEIIFDQEEQDTRIFFLMKGEIEFCFQNKGNKSSEQLSISQTTKNMFFGYKGFISGIPREMTCKSVNVTQVFYCTRQDFITILKENPVEYEKFCKLRDEYLLHQGSLGEQCFSCMEYGHTISNCYKIRLVRNREILILKQNYTADQERQNKERTQRKYATFLNMQLTSFEAMKCKLKNVMILKKQFIPDEILEKIIIDEHITDKDFSCKYPSIKYVDNKDMYLCQIDDNIEYSSCDSNSDLTQMSDSSNDSNTSFSSSSSSQDEDGSSSESSHHKKKKRKQKHHNKSNKQSRQKIQIDTSLDEEEKYQKRTSGQKFENSNDVFYNYNNNQKQINEDYESIDTAQKMTQVPQYNYSEQVQSNQHEIELEDSSVRLHSNQQISELIGIQNMNRPTMPHNNNLKQRELEISNGLLGIINDDSNKQEHTNKQLDKLKIKKYESKVESSDGLKSDFLFSSKAKVTNEMDEKYKNKDTIDRSKSNSQAIANYPQAVMKNYKKQQAKIIQQEDKKEERKSQFGKEKNPQTINKFINIAKQVQSPQNKPKNDKPTFNTPSAIKNQQNQQTSAQQMLIAPLHTPKKPMDQNEMMANFYQGQINRLSMFMNYFQNQNQRAGKLANLPISNIQEIPNIMSTKQLSIIKDDKQDNQSNYNLNRRNRVFNLHEYFNHGHNINPDLENDPEEELFIYDFDSLKEYSIYFPHNNQSIVCQSYKRYMRKLQQQQKKNSKQINPPLLSNVSKHGSKFKKIEQD